MNLFNSPHYRIEDRREILERVYLRLFESPECLTVFRGFERITAENTSNWEARETIVRAMRGI